jgi:two-component system OmpR family response regulator/two-component system response regulator CpxR
MPTATFVLLLEPDVDTRHMYADALAYEGCLVMDTDDVAEAMQMAAVADVIVTASRLRDASDATDVVRRIRETHSRTPILIVTSWMLPTEEVRLRGVGANGVLLKPCLPGVLAAEIRRVLATPRVA